MTPPRFLANHGVPVYPGLMDTLELVMLVILGIGFIGLIAYVASHARQWDDD